MTKLLDNSVLDAGLDEFATTSRLVVCSAAPANFAGIAAVALADVAVTPGDGNGDFTVADGDASGRKVTVAQQANVPIDVTGTATHLSYDDGATLQGVTEVTSQALTSGGTVTIPAHDLELGDPT
jgi:hypothetical protein